MLQLNIHMVVKKLLEFFVTEVDADLFKRIELKNLKIGFKC